VKKKLIVIAIVSALAIGAIFAIGLIFNRNEKLSILPQAITEINYNNYILDNYIDYKENQFAWLKANLWGAKLTVVDNDGNYSYFDKIDAPFQINSKQIIFVKNNKLQTKDIVKNETVKIANNVDKFIAYQNYIIYSSVSIFDDNDGKWKNKLYVYDLSSKESKVIYENITQFYIHKKKLFAINDDKWLVEISLSDYNTKNIIDFEIDQYPFYVMPQGNNILYRSSNELKFLNLTDKSIKTVSIVESQYANNRISYICDDNNVFLSFQATKTNGSIVTDIKDENNGVWAINTLTFEKSKLCSDVFDRLYLFDGEWLFGTKNNSLYRIDIKTKQVTKVSKDR